MRSADLVARYLDDVSNEPDPRLRRAGIESLFDPNVRYVDQDGSVDGHDDFIRRIDDLAAQMGPRARFTLSRPVQSVDDIVLFHWQLGTPEEDPVLRGINIAVVRDGQITRLYALTD